MPKAVEGGSGIELSVVIACLNEKKMIGHQLEALSDQRWTELWGVVIADNGKHFCTEPNWKRRITWP